MSSSTPSGISTPSRIPTGTLTPSSLQSVARQQSRMDELAVKNRTLEHTNEKLRSQLASEISRGKEAMAKVQQLWLEERHHWEQGFETLQVAHKMAHLTTSAELAKEKMLLLKVAEDFRKEGLKKLQRDFRLYQFQTEESKLQERVSQLEDQLRVARTQHQEELSTAEETFQLNYTEVEARCGRLKAEVDTVAEELRTALEEKEQLDTSLSGLRKDYTALLESSSGNNDNDRLKDQLNASQTSHASLESKYTESQRTIADLRQQLKGRETDSKREDAELEPLRKRNVELESQVQELERKIEEADKRDQKAKSRIDKYRVALKEHEAALDEANNVADRYEVDLEKVKNELRKCQEQVERLGSNADTTEAGVDKPPPKHKRPNSRLKSPMAVDPQSEDEVEDEIDETLAVPTTAKPRSKQGTKPPPKARKVSPATDSEINEGSQRPKKSGGSRTKAANDDPDAAAAQSTRKGEGKERAVETRQSDDIPRTKSRKGAKEVKVGSGDEKATKKGKRKAAAQPDDDDDEDESRKRSRTTAGKGLDKSPPPKEKLSKQPKATSKQPDVPPMAIEDVDDTSIIPKNQTQKKKKRKINLFPPAGTSTLFDWGGLSQGVGGLNIPTELSPVKEGDAVPPRSTSRLGSAYGWSQTRRG